MSDTIHTARRGQIYWLNWSPGRGSEQAGRRPALVVQQNTASANPNYPLTIVAAVTTKGRDNVPSHVAIAPTPENGLTAPSYIKCEQVQTVSKERLEGLLGELTEGDMNRVSEALKKVFALV